MAIGDIIVGVDIGTSKVSSVVAEINNFNQVEIIATAESKCFGMKKSKITDEEEIANAIIKTITELEENASLKINSAYITIPGKYVTIVQNSIVKEAKDKYAGISTKDVTSAIMQVKDIDIPEDKLLIDIVTSQFVLDNGRVVDDPVGSLCSSFTVNGQVILADKEYVKQITSVFKKADLEIDGIVPNVLAERGLILEKNELTDNIMILDIGAGNTDIGVFEGDNFIYTNTIPVGGNNITSDIAYVFNIAEEEADKLKRQYGLALKSFIDNDTDIILNTYKGEERTKKIKSSELIEVIEARVEELFTLVKNDISKEGIKSNINNVVLTGQGITSINKSDVAGKIILNIPVKMSTGRLISTIRPSYRSSYALIKYVASRPFARTVSSSIDIKSNESFFKNVMERIKEFFYT
ncbi:MAG: cell division protein FtsA [Clostridiales bacterium]|nr:cell division protein FtsA [Clostridiales bacterium]